MNLLIFLILCYATACLTCIIIYIDLLDYCNNKERAREMLWLPLRLPFLPIYYIILYTIYLFQTAFGGEE